MSVRLYIQLDERRGSGHASAAVLGAAFIEIDLDDLLRRRLKEELVWDKLTDPNGPLSSFNQKILVGYAMGLYEDYIFKNLNVVRAIRNVFAHARTLITFDHPLVSAELRKIAIPRSAHSLAYKNFVMLKDSDDNRFKWAGLCVLLNTAIIRKNVTTIRRKLKIAKKRQSKLNPS